jgi:uncharacterized protein YcnI
MPRSLLMRAGAAAAVIVVATLGLATPASAHVTVNPRDATQGGYTKVAFRVPNERDTATTTALEVNLPTDTPIASVSLKPMAGWTAATGKAKLATPVKTDDGELTEAVNKITWTAAAGNAVKAGQFQEFEVSLGPLPKTDQLVFKALQTYSDGEIVRWIEVPTPGGAEPEHPAPILELAPADDSAALRDMSEVAVQTQTQEGSIFPLFSLVGMFLGLAGLVAGLLAYRRAARPGGPAKTE